MAKVVWSSTQRAPERDHTFRVSVSSPSVNLVPMTSAAWAKPQGGEDYSDTPRGVQIVGQAGRFAGFKKPCMGCGEHVTVLENGLCSTCNGSAPSRRLEELRARAVAAADQALRIMTMAGHWAEAWGLTDACVADYAAKAARQAFHLCREHQLAGGHPADGGQKL